MFWKIVLPILSGLVSLLPVLTIIVGGFLFARTVLGKKVAKSKPWTPLRQIMHS